MKLVLHDMQLLSANAEVVPARFEGVDGLVAQLIGHSIIEIDVPAERIARRICCSPRSCCPSRASPGNGGEVALSRVRALDAQTITLKVDAPVQPQAATRAPELEARQHGRGLRARTA